MRGENAQEELIARSRPSMATAYIKDEEGTVVYYLVTTAWSKGVMVLMALVIVMVLALTALIFIGKDEIRKNSEEIKDLQIETGHPATNNE